MKNEKKFRLDLSIYQVKENTSKRNEDGTFQQREIDYPLRNNLSDYLRVAGMFKTAVEVVDAVMLAKEIRETTAEFIIFSEKDAQILKDVIDKLIMATANGNAQFGGIIHEEAICRVVNMEEIME